MKKQTAVEWLESKLNEEELIIYHGTFNYWVDQAKAMEKEQMFDYTKSTHIIGKATARYFTEDFEKYYNQTYNTDTP
jgi:hypothetical protein